ncbi:MAG: hypothetical protein V2I36_10575 [Desulfopila sp.]|jgi:uncharacterized HAD superfamily protein|nr:hypothetical protein [Desulfopila sp.]
MKNITITPDRIGFDFDGVIADIGEAFLRIACNDYGYCSFRLEDITSFHVESCTSIPETVVRTIFDDILADSLTTGLLPNPGALDVIRDLATRSKVTIITARSFDQPVSDWLEHYLAPDVCRKINLIAMHDHDRKVEYIKQENLQFFVDDRAETCAQVAAAKLHPLLYHQPWNTSWTDIHVVHDWQQIAALIEKE